MPRKMMIAAVSTIAAIGFHIYLTLHYYSLNFGGGAGQSVCNISAVFDCDAVSASQYSEFLGIPMALWGGMTNLILLLLIAISGWRLADNASRASRITLYLASLVVLASVAMGTVSLTLISYFCLFCIATYILSVVTFETLRQSQDGPVCSNLMSDTKALFTTDKKYLLLLVAIPAGAFLIHTSALSQYGIDRLAQRVSNNLADWKNTKTVQLAGTPMLVKGPAASEAKMVISEFADFRCGFCKAVASPIHLFLKSHPDVRMEFYTFPLDGECNDAITGKTGLSCRLAKAVLCSEKQQRGWDMHDYIFKNQMNINQFNAVPQIDRDLAAYASTIGLNWDDVVTCMEAPDTLEAIKQQAKLGHDIGISGTPAVYINGRKMQNAIRIYKQLLEQAYADSQ
ncbi:MAG: DsbA family protein [Pseudobdellovibrionaceae bacterium]|nr:DsbA family protein [Bdellovibrionales bacterium]USN48232.1 MAG: DsbA family protein [Pseudobdellovibrionaceae bacterium]